MLLKYTGHFRYQNPISGKFKIHTAAIIDAIALHLCMIPVYLSITTVSKVSIKSTGTWGLSKFCYFFLPVNGGLGLFWVRNYSIDSIIAFTGVSYKSINTGIQAPHIHQDHPVHYLRCSSYWERILCSRG